MGDAAICAPTLRFHTTRPLLAPSAHIVPLFLSRNSRRLASTGGNSTRSRVWIAQIVLNGGGRGGLAGGEGGGGLGRARVGARREVAAAVLGVAVVGPDERRLTARPDRRLGLLVLELDGRVVDLARPVAVHVEVPAERGKEEDEQGSAEDDQKAPPAAKERRRRR